MKKYVLAAALLCLLPATSFAQAEKADPGSLSEKAKKDQPGTTGGGSTAEPTAKPEDDKQSLPGKAAEDHPGTNAGGPTANPTADPKSGSLNDKAKETTK
jgi:hypothetical protein